MGNSKSAIVGPIDPTSDVRLEDFDQMRNVGKGAFGKVKLVKRKGTEEIYALKYINKEECVKMKAVEQILRERKLLEETEHDFLVNMRYAFQDQDHLYLVLDVMLGGALDYHIVQIKGFSEDSVRLFAAEISLGLNYLHSKNIVHRDIKPANLLLDMRGHVHITDFNVAGIFDEKKMLTSRAGTRPYMAPEMLKKKPYTTSVDWWSLGVVLYELLWAKRPFRADKKKSYTKEIIAKKIHFGRTNGLTGKEIFVSETCQDLIKKLLEKSPDDRLACGPAGYMDFMKHPLFRDINWETLSKMEMTPAFLPKERANFDAMHDVEEIMNNQAPLGNKAKRPASAPVRNAVGNYTPVNKSKRSTKELEKLENGFKSYNYKNRNTREANVPKILQTESSRDLFGEALAPDESSGGLADAGDYNGYTAVGADDEAPASEFEGMQLV